MWLPVFGRNLVPPYEIWLAGQSNKIVEPFAEGSQSLWLQPIKPSQMLGLILDMEWLLCSKNSQNEQ